MRLLLRRTRRVKRLAAALQGGGVQYRQQLHEVSLRERAASLARVAGRGRYTRPSPALLSDLGLFLYPAPVHAVAVTLDLFTDG